MIFAKSVYTSLYNKLLFILLVSLPQVLLAEGEADAASDAPRSVIDLMMGSGPVVRFVLLILIVMSIVTWGIVITKGMQFRKARNQSAEFWSSFWGGRNLGEINQVSQYLTQSPLASVFCSGYKELSNIVRKKQQQEEAETSGNGNSFGDLENIERALKKAKAEELTRLENGLIFLATTASAAPFIGLFGTVWGIMNAFMGLSHVKTTSLQAVAPGISEALIATAIGLFAAIPAAIAFNYFSQQVKVLARNMDMFAAEFLNMARINFLR